MTRIIDILKQYGDIEENKSMKTLTTFHVGGQARYVIYPFDLLSLGELIKFLSKENIKYKLFGKGSNLLCSDDFFDGAIIKLDKHITDSYYQDNVLVAQAGSSIIVLAYETMKKGLSGLEFASGIPGTIGGCVYMNAGAYKASMSDIVSEVLVLKNNELVWMNAKDCEFSYRTSIFQKNPDWIILAAKLNLHFDNVESIRDVIEERKQRRMDTQPLDFPSAGSVFRNPESSFAWKYIQDLGLRGFKIGDAMVSDKHANFIINVGQAKANDVKEIIETINQKMEKQYGFTLHTEVEWFNWEE